MELTPFRLCIYCCKSVVLCYLLIFLLFHQPTSAALQASMWLPAPNTIPLNVRFILSAASSASTFMSNAFQSVESPADHLASSEDAMYKALVRRRSSSNAFYLYFLIDEFQMVQCAPLFEVTLGCLSVSGVPFIIVIFINHHVQNAQNC